MNWAFGARGAWEKEREGEEASTEGFFAFDFGFDGRCRFGARAMGRFPACKRLIAAPLPELIPNERCIYLQGALSFLAAFHSFPPSNRFTHCTFSNDDVHMIHRLTRAGRTLVAVLLNCKLENYNTSYLPSGLDVLRSCVGLLHRFSGRTCVFYTQAT